MGNLSAHFDSSEFTCRCGCGACKVSPRLIDALEELRALIGKPIHVISGRRCPKHNKAVGGATRSQHMRGTAADITVRDMSPAWVKRYVERVESFQEGGIGTYPVFAHVDVRRNGPARW